MNRRGLGKNAPARKRRIGYERPSWKANVVETNIPGEKKRI